MSIHIGINAVPPGAMAWALAHAPLPSHNVFYYRTSEYRTLRGITDGPPSHLTGGAGIGPGWRSTRTLYEALTGEPAGDFWGTPARDRYKRALVGGDTYIEVGDEDLGPARWSTAAEAAEAVETVREISERGGPRATRAELEGWNYEIEKYRYFFERYQPGEELFYLLY